MYFNRIQPQVWIREEQYLVKMRKLASDWQDQFKEINKSYCEAVFNPVDEKNLEFRKLSRKAVSIVAGIWRNAKNLG